MGETWSRGTNSRLPFVVNVMPNLSIVSWFPEETWAQRKPNQM